MKRPVEAYIPMPVVPVIDDVGWWSGTNDLARNGPARTGMPRDHVPEDYEAIVRLGQRLNIRVQAAMILCEWDTRNLLRELPESTWMGSEWDNRRWVGPWLEQAARIINDNRDHFEFALHGLCHSSWPGGTEEGSEFFDLQRGQARPAGELRAHLRYYQAIMQEHGFGEFPETFVSPCSHCRFGAGPSGLTGVLKSAGVKYLSAAFSCHNWAVQHHPAPSGGAAINTPIPAGQLFTVDRGLMIVDRARNFVPWDAVDCHPTEALGPIPLVGLHWPNILHPDPQRNDEVVDRWVAYLEQLDREANRILARDTPMGWAQLACCSSIKLSCAGSTLSLDFATLNALKILHLNDWFVVKIISDRPPSLEGRGVRVLSVTRHPEAHNQWLVTIQRPPGQQLAEIAVR